MLKRKTLNLLCVLFIVSINKKSTKSDFCVIGTTFVTLWIKNIDFCVHFLIRTSY